jgi:hypothetical protein
LDSKRLEPVDEAFDDMPDLGDGEPNFDDSDNTLAFDDSEPDFYDQFAQFK